MARRKLEDLQEASGKNFSETMRGMRVSATWAAMSFLGDKKRSAEMLDSVYEDARDKLYPNELPHKSELDALQAVVEAVVTELRADLAARLKGL